MIRVFTKKTLEFKNRDSGEMARTPVLDFCQLPDWVAHDPLFQWAKDDGNLQEFEQESKSAKKPKQPVAGQVGDENVGL